MISFFSTSRATPRVWRSVAAGLFALAVPLLSAGAGAVELAPHKAVYKLSLAKVRSSSSVSGVIGRMQYAFDDACDGWTIEQKFQLRFSYAEGEDVDMTTNYVTWEAKDGRSFRFNVRKTVNGKPDEELSGDAGLRAGGGGSAHYTKPEQGEVALPADLLFPTAHTVRVIELAERGERFFARPVFDGSEAKGSVSVTAVLGPSKALDDVARQPASLRRDKAWPIHLAFYPADPAGTSPEYETQMMMTDNGIIQSMLIDYGEFKMNAVLESLETIPAHPC